ncbi:MAG: acetyl-CoA carboxylase biotin carboxyl carrier protein subunit [Bacteroidota bacterium]
MNGDNKKRALLLEEGKYYTYFSSKFEKRKNWVKPNDKVIKSVIPGTIIKCSVKEGQKVKTGDVLLILEAMKMHNKILSPMNGVIEKVSVKTGDKIPKNELMIEFV